MRIGVVDAKRLQDLQALDRGALSVREAPLAEVDHPEFVQRNRDGQTVRRMPSFD